MWHDIFVAGVPLLERVVRAALIYIFAVVALRLAGKRELGQLSTFDLVVLLFFSNILQNAVIGADNSVTGGVVGAATFLALQLPCRARDLSATSVGDADRGPAHGPDCGRRGPDRPTCAMNWSASTN